MQDNAGFCTDFSPISPLCLPSEGTQCHGMPLGLSHLSFLLHSFIDLLMGPTQRPTPCAKALTETVGDVDDVTLEPVQRLMLCILAQIPGNVSRTLFRTRPTAATIARPSASSGS